MTLLRIRDRRLNPRQPDERWNEEIREAYRSLEAAKADVRLALFRTRVARLRFDVTRRLHMRTHG